MPLNVLDWLARIDTRRVSCDVMPGLVAAQSGGIVTDVTAPLSHLPMMTARRLSPGSRLAADCALALMRRHPVQAMVFSSRHGELDACYRMLQSLAAGEPVSPTAFAMSVHNTVAGVATIVSRTPAVTSCIAAGVDGFQQAIHEVLNFLWAGYDPVALVDYESDVPAFYREHAGVTNRLGPYAVSLLFEAGGTLECHAGPRASGTGAEDFPQSVQFINGFAGGASRFIVHGERNDWRWTRGEDGIGRP